MSLSAKQTRVVKRVIRKQNGSGDGDSLRNGLGISSLVTIVIIAILALVYFCGPSIIMEYLERQERQNKQRHVPIAV
eukprot:CAMPEP_0172469762 /NCGR_PEP_ID=MMETSP1065-20121228/64577_1 /TAXON_ID=265537 /ORGANISM="Amphiprora paludosa, Strain CCMP125" /LENGTH=76 /DNA_ID=CAMNT_0013227513 /DNA_START=53 /DNA_END=279 /DNA_ORIENTATION=-